MMKKIIISLMMAALMALTACSPTYDASNRAVDQTQQQIKKADLANTKPVPIVTSNQGYYVNPNPVAFNNDPSWLKQNISLEANQIPLNLLMNRLLRNASVAVSYDPTVDAQTLVNIHYQGSIKGALKNIADSTNYFYQLQDQNVHWSALETRQFDISFMPGASNYLVGQPQNTANAGTISTTDPGAAALNDSQYSNLQGRLSIWNDLTNTLNQLKSKDGRVIVSESSTQVTVQDHPSNVTAMADYITKLNQSLTQQVSIRVQVLEVELNKDFNYGINWNMLTKALGTNLSVVGNGGGATTLISNDLIAGGGTSAVSQIGVGSSGTDAVVQALSQQGKVSVVTEPEVVTMNNQIASIRITNTVGYIQSVSQTQNENFNTTAITPGTVTDGLTLYLLPKIQDKKVYMQISSTIANLIDLQKESTSPTDAATNNTSTNSQYEAIQVPTLAQKSFNQRSLVNSGGTLIIAGYKRLRDATSNASFFGIPPLGGRGAQDSDVETLVLITPIILRSNQANVVINSQ